MQAPIVLDDARTVLVTAPEEPLPSALGRPFVCLVAAMAAPDEAALAALVIKLVNAGCMELVFAGAAHSQFHDVADVVLEEHGHLSVGTWGNVDAADASAYFLFAAGGVLPGLLALIADAPPVLGALRLVLERREGP